MRHESFFCDKEEQAAKLEGWVLPEETLYCVLDLKGGGTGFIGVTDRRLIFQDSAFLTRHKAMVSLPFSKITAFASEDAGTMLRSSKLILTAGSQAHVFDFRGADKAHWVYNFLAGRLR